MLFADNISEFIDKTLVKYTKHIKEIDKHILAASAYDIKRETICEMNRYVYAIPDNKTLDPKARMFDLELREHLRKFKRKLLYATVNMATAVLLDYADSHNITDTPREQIANDILTQCRNAINDSLFAE